MRRFSTAANFVLTTIFVFYAATTMPAIAQSKANKKTVKKPPVVIKTDDLTRSSQTVENGEAIESGDKSVETKSPAKKNGRPAAMPPEPAAAAENPQTGEPQKKNQSQKASAVNNKGAKDVFAYEFSQPEFVVSRILIEHDETGKGIITFEKKNFGGDPITDPIQLSAVSLGKIKNLYQSLNFLDSTEDYQSAARQYPHLGTMKIRRKSGERERTAQFNWTENADAKALADEYRRIGNQFVWIFDINLSLENQPLEAPGLMDALASLLRRNEISDPVQMLALLKNLSNDERIPLIARNHAARIVKDIEKKSKDGK